VCLCVLGCKVREGAPGEVAERGGWFRIEVYDLGVDDMRIVKRQSEWNVQLNVYMDDG
jgi:hypothetical protein